MDLSKVPDLDLRQKVKPLNDRISALDAMIYAQRAAMEEKIDAAVKPLEDEKEKIEGTIAEMLGDDRELDGTCAVSGLPLFAGDDVTGHYVYRLACLSDTVKAAA